MEKPSSPAQEAISPAPLNSIEMVTMPWVVLSWSGQQSDAIDGWLDKRLGQLEVVLAGREFLVADRFTAADLMMADVLRLELLCAHGDRPASEAYVDRMLSRPAFKKALADQLAQYEAADRAREENEDA